MQATNSFDLVNAVAVARDHIRSEFEGLIDQAVILGSGLSDLALKNYMSVIEFDYADIPGLPESTAPSHQGRLKIVSDGRQTLALCAGRHHLYEGYSAQQVCALTYLLNALGANTLVFTNAAGSLNPDYNPGDVMLIEDHINFTGHNPVRGQDQTFGVEFPDMSQAYDRDLVKTLISIADSESVNLHKGIYIGVMGPSLETSAERRMLRTFGADAVGMSTVLEVIAANHANMRVVGLSAITNSALGDENQQPDTIEEVLAHASIAGEQIKRLLENYFG